MMTKKRAEVKKRLLYFGIVFVAILLLSSFVSDFILGKTTVFLTLKEAVKELIFSLKRGTVLEAPPVVYYVSPTGGGNHDGSSFVNAFTVSESIAYANAHLAENITFLMNSGNYGGVIFTSLPARTGWDSGVLYKAYNSANPPLLSNLSISNSYNSYIEFNGLELFSTTPITIITGRKSGHLKFNNLNIHGIWTGSYSTLAYGMQFSDNPGDPLMNDIKIYNSNLYNLSGGIIFTNHIGNGYELVNNTVFRISASAMRFEGGSSGNNSNILVENNTIYNQIPLFTGIDYSHGSALTLRTDNLTIRGNVIYDYGTTGGIYDYGGVLAWNGSTNNVIENNLIYDMYNQYALYQQFIKPPYVIRSNTVVGLQQKQAIGYKYQSPFFLKNYTTMMSNMTLNNNIIIGVTGISNGLRYNATSNLLWSVLDGNKGGNWVSTIDGVNNVIITNGVGNPFDPFQNNFFVNAPKYCERLPMKTRGYAGLTLGINGASSTLTSLGANFEGLKVSVAPGFVLNIVSGGSNLSCYNASLSFPYSGCIFLYIKEVSGDTITLYRNVTVQSGLVNATIFYSSNSGNKIYTDLDYFVGDNIEYEFISSENATVVSMGTDSIGKFIILSRNLNTIPLPADVICNWGQKTNFARDYRPLSTSLACNGSLNSPGVAVGALPCVSLQPVCTNGQTRNCALQQGVCAGKQEICIGGNWPGCTIASYGVDYQIIEANCNDGKDNDCDGLTDSSDTNCAVIDITPPVISSIVNGSITNQSAIVSWLTDEGANSRVYYGLTTNLGSEVLDINSLISHSLQLTNLLSNTTYYYKVGSCDVSGNCANSSLFNFKTTAGAFVDSEGPIVSLSSPANGNDLSSNSVTFSYTPIDFSPISSCTLYLGVETRVDDAIENSIENNFSVNLANGYYYWSISCVDSSGNRGESETRILNINYQEPVYTSGGGGYSSGGGGGSYIAPQPKVDKINETLISEQGIDKISLQEGEVGFIDIGLLDSVVLDLYSILYEIRFEVSEAGVLLKVPNGDYLIPKDDILPVLLGGQEMYVAVKRADANGAGIILGLNRELVREQLGESSVSETSNTAYIIIGIIIVIIGIILLVGYIIYRRDKTKQIEPAKWVGNSGKIN